MNKAKTAFTIARKSINTNLAQFCSAIESEPESLNLSQSDGSLLIHLVSRYGDLGALTFLVKKGLSVNATNKKGTTPLHLSAGSGHLDCTKFLVEQGAHLNAQTYEGVTPLQTVAFYGDFPCFQYLIRAGADISIVDRNGCTLLHWAARSENEQILNWTVNRMGNLMNEKDAKGLTPVECAVLSDLWGNVRILITKGCDISMVAGNSSVRRIYDDIMLQCEPMVMNSPISSSPAPNRSKRPKVNLVGAEDDWEQVNAPRRPPVAPPPMMDNKTHSSSKSSESNRVQQNSGSDEREEPSNEILPTSDLYSTENDIDLVVLNPPTATIEFCIKNEDPFQEDAKKSVSTCAFHRDNTDDFECFNLVTQLIEVFSIEELDDDVDYETVSD
ncbi:putative ankyrin repeat domain protein [Blattamonas nauphoetae]|uniref:Ankyrin repeat domain protein n=1 Tax=Blattamonas nauphoetae TaxID=2049346 RepID=A0ABQ9YCX1_9EUKA|nr:putative ankyrin repeat domain protein [Blattamonas nauphoetae]